MTSIKGREVLIRLQKLNLSLDIENDLPSLIDIDTSLSTSGDNLPCTLLRQIVDVDGRGDS